MVGEFFMMIASFGRVVFAQLVGVEDFCFVFLSITQSQNKVQALESGAGSSEAPAPLWFIMAEEASGVVRNWCRRYQLERLTIHESLQTHAVGWQMLPDLHMLPDLWEGLSSQHVIKMANHLRLRVHVV